MGLVLYGTWANRPLGFTGKDFASKPVSNARNWKNGSFVSVPVGYYQNALVMPLKYGGIAVTLRGSGACTISEITGASDLACTTSGTSSITANGALGRNLECTIEGSGGVTASIDAKGVISCTIQIGAQPSAFDIAQAVLNAVAAQYNIPGTIGEAIQAGGGAGGLTTDQNNQLMSTLTTAKFLGLK